MQCLGWWLSGAWFPSDWLVVRRIFQAQSSALWFQLVWDLSTFPQCVVATFHLGWGMNVLVPTEQIKDVDQMMYIPWGGIRTLFYYWAIIIIFLLQLLVCLFLHSLSFLLSNCMSLLFEAQARPRRLKPFPTTKKQGMPRGFCSQEGPAGSCPVSASQRVAPTK